MRRLALAISLCWIPRPAGACSCDESFFTISIDGGAVDVPLNAVAIVRSIHPVDLVWTDLASGLAVEITTETIAGEAHLFRPVAPLSPETDHEITYSTYWFGPSTVPFRTGSTLDTTPPAFDGLASFFSTSMAFDDVPCANSCVATQDGWFVNVALEYELPPDARLAVLESGDERILLHPKTSFEDAHDLATFACGIRPPRVAPGVETCVRIVVYDGAGNQAGLDRESCHTTIECETKVDLGTCLPTGPCTLPRPDAGPDPFLDDGDAGRGCACAAAPRRATSPVVWIAALFLVRRVAKRNAKSATCPRRRRRGIAKP